MTKEKDFYEQSYHKRLGRILKIYGFLEKRGQQVPLITLIKQLYDMNMYLKQALTSSDNTEALIKIKYCEDNL